MPNQQNLSSLMTIVADRVNNPLSDIRLNIDIAKQRLTKTNPSSDITEFLDRALEAINKIRRTIDELRSPAIISVSLPTPPESFKPQALPGLGEKK